MPQFETANILLALGGDAGCTVPKFGVTAAEIAVLRAIHGEDAVIDIEPLGTVERTNRAELDRVRAIYGRATDGNMNSIVNFLYPGAAARVFESLDELGIPEDFYKAETRVSRKPKPAPEPAVVDASKDVDLVEMTKAQSVTYAEALGFEADATLTKDKLIASVENFLAARSSSAQVEEDGIEDMDAPGVMA
jgi:hypothetical protein